jgi:hypothetical protein
MATPEEERARLAEEKANEKLSDSFVNLNEEETQALSKALFPDSHTAEVTLLGKKRDLRPLPLKYARQLNTAIKPYSEAFQNALMSNATIKLDEEVLEVLQKSAVILADYYNWEDVKVAVPEDGLSLSELQALASTQTQLNGVNDFLLSPLRVCIRTMQVFEVANIRYHTLLISRFSRKNGNAASTNSSQSTLKASSP